MTLSGKASYVTLIPVALVNAASCGCCGASSGAAAVHTVMDDAGVTPFTGFGPLLDALATPA